MDGSCLFGSLFMLSRWWYTDTDTDADADADADVDWW